MYYPIVLLVIYGLAAVPLVFNVPSSFQGYVGVDFSNITLLFSFLIMMSAAMAHFIGFNLGYRYPSHISIFRSKSTDKAFAFGAILLGIFDLTIRIQQVASGQYFSWMKGQAAEIYGDDKNALWILQDGLAPLLAAIAAHRIKKSRWWMVYLLALLAALVLEGKRMKIVLVLFAVILVIFVFRRFRISPIRIFSYLLIVTFSLSFGLSVVVESRIMYRSNITEALNNPIDFVQDIAFEVIPRTFVKIFDFSMSETNLVQSSTFSHRMPTWSIAFSSEVERVYEVGHLPARYMFEELAIVVPSALWPGQKPSIGISTVIANHYNLWAPGHISAHSDLASTAVVNPYLYFGFFGIIFYSMALGALLAWVACFAIKRFGFNGILLLIGSVYYIRPLSNSMAGPIVGVRNFLLLILFFIAIDAMMRFLPRRTGNYDGGHL